MEPVVGLITAVVLLVTAVVGFMLKLQKGIQEIHVLVNSRMSEALERIDQLGDLLDTAGIAIPNGPEPDDWGGDV